MLRRFRFLCILRSGIVSPGSRLLPPPLACGVGVAQPRGAVSALSSFTCSYSYLEPVCQPRKEADCFSRPFGPVSPILCSISPALFPYDSIDLQSQLRRRAHPHSTTWMLNDESLLRLTSSACQPPSCRPSGVCRLLSRSRPSVLMKRTKNGKSNKCGHVSCVLNANCSRVAPTLRPRVEVTVV